MGALSQGSTIGPGTAPAYDTTVSATGAAGYGSVGSTPVGAR